MIAILADGHVRQQPRSRQTLLDRLHRLLRCDHRAALAAGVFLTGFLDHIQRSRHVFQPLTDLLADVLQLSLALGTFPFLFSEIVDHAPPLEGFGKRRRPCPRRRGVVVSVSLSSGRGRISCPVPMIPRHTGTADFHSRVRASARNASAATAPPCAATVAAGAPWCPAPRVDRPPSAARQQDLPATYCDQSPWPCFAAARSAFSSSIASSTHSLTSSAAACSWPPSGASRAGLRPHESRAALAPPGKAQLIIRPVPARLLGIFALAARRATHVVLLADTAGMQGPQFGQALLEFSIWCAIRCGFIPIAYKSYRCPSTKICRKFKILSCFALLRSRYGCLAVPPRPCTAGRL